MEMDMQEPGEMCCCCKKEHDPTAMLAKSIGTGKSRPPISSVLCGAPLMPSGHIFTP